MDHVRVMGFLLLLFSTLFSLQFVEARVLEDSFHNGALHHHNSAQLDAVAVASSRQNYTAAGGHVTKYKESESNPVSNSENSTQDANMIAVELLQKEATPEVGSRSKAPEGIEEVASIKGNADILHEVLNSDSRPGVGHMSVNDGIESNILSSGPSPGVGNGHTSAIAGTQSQSGTFNKLPSGPSPGVGHKVTNGYTEMAQESESKKSAIMMNKLPSGPSPGVGHSDTNGRSTMEKISIESESKKNSEFALDPESKKESAFMNILPSGPSPGVGHSATNGRNTMEKNKQEREEGMGIQTFNKLPSGPSPGVGHSYTNAHEAEKLQRASEDRKGSDNVPISQKLPGGPSPGGGHSYVQKSASTVRVELSSNAVIKTSSSPSPGDGNSKPSGSQKKTVEQTGEALDRKIGCDAGSYMDRLSGTSQFFEGSNFYGTPTPPMFGIAAGGDSRISNF